MLKKPNMVKIAWKSGRIGVIFAHAHKQTHCFHHTALIVLHGSALGQCLWQLVQL